MLPIACLNCEIKMVQLCRDLSSQTAAISSVSGVAVGVVSDSDRNNKNFSKYKVNRVAAAAASAAAASNKLPPGGNESPSPAVSTGTVNTTTTSSVINTRPSKSARRAMAEKCLEAVVAQVGIPVELLVSLFPAELRKAVRSVAGILSAQAVHVAAESAKHPSFNSYFTD